MYVSENLERFPYTLIWPPAHLSLLSWCCHTLSVWWGNAGSRPTRRLASFARFFLLKMFSFPCLCPRWRCDEHWWSVLVRSGVIYIFFHRFIFYAGNASLMLHRPKSPSKAQYIGDVKLIAPLHDCWFFSSPLDELNALFRYADHSTAVSAHRHWNSEYFWG